MLKLSNPFARALKRKPTEHIRKPTKQGLTEHVERDVPIASNINERHWRNALGKWVDRQNPDRVEMYQIFNMIWLYNPRILGMWRTREEHLINQAFNVFDINGNVNEEWTERLQVPGFEEFRKIAQETPWYGHSLMEIRHDKHSKRWYPFLFPRTNVCPERHTLKLNDTDEIDYTAEKFGNLIELGDRFEVGWLAPVALKWIAIEFLKTRRNQYLDRYAFPTLQLAIVNNTPEHQQKLNQQLKNFSNVKSIITGADDELTLHETNPSQTNQFVRVEKELESEIREMILGSKPTAFDGNNEAAKRQRIFTRNKLAADKRIIEKTVNASLLPVLGAPPGLRFKFEKTTMKV